MGVFRASGAGVRVACVAAACAITVAARPARGAMILNFEGGGTDGGEGLVNTNYTIGSFGATSGTHADDATVSTSSGTIFDIGTVTAGSTGAGLTHYNAINAGMAEAQPLQLSFDIAINTANVTTDGYFQITLIGNSNNGYFDDGYGNLINGYNIDEGLTLNSHAAAQGATLTTTTRLANGISAYHFTIPVLATPQSDGTVPTLGPGAGNTGNSGFYQLSLVASGGWGGTALVGLDNLQIGAIPAVPEPASMALVAVPALTLLGRRRRSA